MLVELLVVIVVAVGEVDVFEKWVMRNSQLFIRITQFHRCIHRPRLTQLRFQPLQLLRLIIHRWNQIGDLQLSNITDFGFGLFVLVFLALFAKTFGGVAKLLVDFVNGGLFCGDFGGEFGLVGL